MDPDHHIRPNGILLGARSIEGRRRLCCTGQGLWLGSRLKGFQEFGIEVHAKSASTSVQDSSGYRAQGQCFACPEQRPNLPLVQTEAAKTPSQHVANTMMITLLQLLISLQDHRTVRKIFRSHKKITHSLTHSSLPGPCFFCCGSEGAVCFSAAVRLVSFGWLRGSGFLAHRTKNKRVPPPRPFPPRK